jgi:hypothetical protein
MTSDAREECFVYVTLPGQTEPVTAGRFVLAGDRRGVPEGRFVYGRSYLERSNAVALDPVELKLSTRTYSTVAMGGMFGALRDASPDYWGRRLIQRHLGKAQPGEMDYLLFSPDDRAGRWDSASTARRLPPGAASTRPWIWRKCRPSPMQSSPTTTAAAGARSIVTMMPLPPEAIMIRSKR